MKTFQVKKTHISTGEKIAYVHEGSGDKILLIHGNMSSSVFYYRTIEALSKSFEVYALDLRGFGDSSYNTKITSLYDLSLDVAAFINEKNIKSVNLVGWSAGGGVCLELMSNPYLKDKINACILLSSVGVKGLKGFDDAVYLKSLGYEDINKEFLKSNFDLPNINNVMKENMSYAIDNVKSWYSQLFNFDNLENRKSSIETLYKYYVYNVKEVESKEFNRNIEAALKQRNQAEMSSALNSFNVVTNGKIKEIKTPILMLHGLKDLIVKPYIAEKSIEELGDNASLKFFKNAGHSLMTDVFDKYIEEIIHFFAVKY